MGQLDFPVTEKEAKNRGIVYSSENNKSALFPSTLREQRKKRGISQADLAKILGVSKSTVGLWETGDTLPDAKALRDMANYYDVPSDYLLGLTADSYKTPRATDDLGLSIESVNVLTHLKDKSSDTVSKFIGTVDFIRLINQINYLSRLVDEVKQLPHSGPGEWDSEIGSVKEKVETKSWEKDLSKKLGYPVYVVTPDKLLAGELQIVRELAGNLAKEISGMKEAEK